MSVSKKLAAGFLIVLVIAVIVGIMGVIGMQTLRESGRYMYENRVRGLEYVHEAVTAYHLMRAEAQGVITNSFYDDKKGTFDSHENFERHAGNFVFLMEKSREIASTDEMIKFHDRILELFNEEYYPKTWQNNINSINDTPDHNNRLYINVQLASIADVTNRIENLLTGLVALNTALASQTNIDNSWLTQVFIAILTALLVIAVCCVGIVARFIIKSITTPIEESEKVLGEIAHGNFNARVIGDYTGNFKTIKDSVNNTAFRLSLYLDEKMLAERLAHESELEKARIEATSEALMAGINYANKIQRNILPGDYVFKDIFLDYSIMWEPRDIVGGDIYWLKQFESGSVLCVCDCTGHGTPGALLTMLVTSALESAVLPDNCHDTADIIWQLEQQLVSLFGVNDQDKESETAIREGCDLAVLFIAKDGSVTMSSAHTHVFVCDGKEVQRIKGQHIYIGHGDLRDKNDIKTVNIPYDSKNKLYIATDGLFDQGGGEHGRPYGYNEFQKIVLKNHNDPQAVISDKIRDAFEKYRGSKARVDDFELVTFVPLIKNSI